MSRVITEALEAHHQWASFIDTQVGGREVEDTARNRVVFMLLQLAVEAYMSSILLVKNEHYSSAINLIRGLFDSLAKAHYFAEAGTDRQCERYLLGKEVKGKMQMFDKMKAELTSMHQELREFQDGRYSELSEFAHGGLTAVAMRFSQHKLEGAAKEKLVNDILFHGAHLGYLVAAQAVLVLCGDMAVVNEKMEELFSGRFEGLEG